MKVKELSSMLYRMDDEDEVMVLNENAPLKGAVPVKAHFQISEDGLNNKLILVYESKNGKEGK